MDEFDKQWKEIHHRLRTLDESDQEEEPRLLAEAYERLMVAYQEARKLNDEMEALLQENFNTLIL